MWSGSRHWRALPLGMSGGRADRLQYGLEMGLFDERVVVLLTGISASGKSTVGQLLAEQFTRGVHVRGDVFRRMVVSGREEMTDQPSSEAWHQLLLRYRIGASVADTYFEAGFSVVVQDVVVGPVLDEYIAGIHSRPLLVVVLAPRPAVVLEREAVRPKTAYGSGRVTVDDFDTALRQTTPHVGLWLDSSGQTPQETVAEIVKRVWSEGQIA